MPYMQTYQQKYKTNLLLQKKKKWDFVAICALFERELALLVALQVLSSKGDEGGREDEGGWGRTFWQDIVRAGIEA